MLHAMPPLRPAHLPPPAVASCPPAHERVLQTVGSKLAAVALTVALAVAPPALAATDAAKVGTCLLANCQAALARCLADGQCAANLICLNACSGRPDETACQIRCGDKYSDAAIDAFNKCAVSDKKCVPQRVDEGAYPVPPDCAQDAKFDLSAFTGRWFISAGLNPLFDTFDCQAHFFANPAPGRLVARINWRIPAGTGAGGVPDFMERSTVQTFVQGGEDPPPRTDPSFNPAYLANHGNEYLHYEDDWYILASKPDQYVFVYYKGNNDAWRGYGGAVVYTRAAALPPEYVPELSAAAEAAGLKWSDFTLTDNTCGPHPPPESLAEKAADLERAVVQDVVAVEKAVAADVRKVESVVAADVRKVEDVLAADAAAVKRAAVAEARALAEARKKFGESTISFGKGFTVMGGKGMEGMAPGGMPAPMVAESPDAAAARAADMADAEAALRKEEARYKRPAFLPSWLGGRPDHAR